MLQFLILGAFFAMISQYFNCWYIFIVYILFWFLIKLKLLPLIVIKLKDIKDFLHDVRTGTYFKRIYGIYSVVGEYGQGKTIEMARQFLMLNKKTPFHNPDDYIFVSNFDLVGTEHFDNLKDIMSYYQIALQQGKGLIIFWDEIQNDYPENDRDFPQAFRTLLTQNRKNRGVRLVWSTQDYTRVNKNIRLMTTKISQMRCYLGRYMIRQVFNRAVYDDYYACTDVMLKVKRKSLFTQVYIQTDDIRSAFDSFKMLNIAKKHLHID